MINKNDPLIAAVQKVMQSNQAERDAVASVNEKFGVTDRRALPRERQHEWDSAYKTVLSEGVEGSIPKTPKERELAKAHGDPEKITHGDVLKKRGVFEGKKMKDDPCWDTHEMVGMKKGKGGKPVPNCVPVKEQMKDPYGADTTSPSSMGIKPDRPLTAAEKPKSSSVTPADQSALKKKIQGIMKEAKTNPYAIGMAAVQKSTGDQPPMEKKNITKAHEIAKKIMKKMNEANLSRADAITQGRAKEQAAAVTASVKKQSMTGTGVREPDNKTGSTSGSGGLMRPLQQTRQDNYADRMNRNVRVDTAKKTGGAITGREDKWAARPETGNLKSYAPAPGTLGDKLKTAAGGGSTPVPKRDAADSAPRPQPGADRLAAQKAGAAARGGSAPGSAPVNSSQPGSNKLFAQKAARDQSSKMGGGGTMGTKTPVPVPKAKPSVPGKKVVPAAGKTSPAPAAVQKRPSAQERIRARVMLDRGGAVGPEARRLQKTTGTGVTTGKTIVQKARPMAKRPIGMGREK